MSVMYVYKKLKHNTAFEVNGKTLYSCTTFMSVLAHLDGFPNNTAMVTCFKENSLYCMLRGSFVPVLVKFCRNLGQQCRSVAFYTPKQ